MSDQPAPKARLRHFALVVSDLERSARFYEEAFGLERVGRDDLPIGSGIYLSDGTVNLALLRFADEAANAPRAHHFGFIVDDIEAVQRRVEEGGGRFAFDLGKTEDEPNFERKFHDPDGILFDLSRKGWLGSSR